MNLVQTSRSERRPVIGLKYHKMAYFQGFCDKTAFTNVLGAYEDFIDLLDGEFYPSPTCPGYPGSSSAETWLLARFLLYGHPEYH
jgi:hypothetical protein